MHIRIYTYIHAGYVASQNELHNQYRNGWKIVLNQNVAIAGLLILSANNLSRAELDMLKIVNKIAYILC